MRTRSRRLLLLGILVALVAGGGGLYLRRERMLDDEARAAREAGLAALVAQDYPLAVRKLSQFVKRLDPDALALLRYGQAIRGLPGVDRHHREVAVVCLRRSVSKNPDGAEARRELLTLYGEVGMRTEAIEQAKWFLDRDPGDLGALKAQATALAEMRRFQDAFDVVEGRIRPETPDLEAQLLYVGLLASLKKPASEVLERADAVEAANATDPRFRLVGARARLVTEDVPGAREALKRLVAVAQQDRQFARLLIPHLDAVGLPRLSLEVLSSFEPKDLEPEMRLQLVRRLWEVGDAAGIERHISSWRLDPDALPTATLSYQILALSRLKRLDDARRLFAVIQSRSEDSIGQGWVRLIEGTVLADTPSVAERISAASRALESDSSNPQSHFVLGLAYRDAGEIELAIRELGAAGALSPNWSEPAALGARILAESGRLPAAVAAAMAAEARGSQDPGVTLLVNLARSASDATTGGTISERVLRGWKAAGLPDRDTLPIRIALAAATDRSGTANELKALIEEILGLEMKPDGEVLLACMMLSRARGLGVEARCVAKYEDLYGNTPALALALARKAAVSDGAKAGLDLLQTRRASAKEGDASTWLAAEATYLEAHGTQGEALLAWQKLAPVATGRPGPLRAALEAASTWKDLDFTRVLIDKLRDSTGKACLWWRYHEARWRLSAPKVDPTASDAAIAELRGILDVAPEHVRARLLLVGALENRGDAQRALDQLVIARAGQGRSIPFDLALARLHLKVGDWAAARTVLEQMLGATASGSVAITSEERLGMAALFARLGERKSVLELLEQGGEKTSDPEETLGRAELYAAVGELDRAESMIRPVLGEKDSPEALLLGAALADFQGRAADSAALLERISRLTPDSLKRDRMLADHFLRVGNLAAAEGHLRGVVRATDATSSDWSRLLACQVLQGKQDAVSATLEEARSHGALGKQGGSDGLAADVLRFASARVELRELGVAYIQSETQRSAAEQAIRFLEAAERTEPSTTEQARFRALAQVNPTFLALQMAVADFLARRRDFDGAILVCRNAAVALPMAPEPHQAMAHLYRAMGSPNRARDAVKEWRARSTRLPLEPDLFLAEQSSPAEASALLEPYLPRAIEKGIFGVLVGYGQALILQKNSTRVAAVLAPNLARSRTVVRAWVVLAGVEAARGDAARAATWLEREEIQAASAEEPEIRIELATAWQFVASATGSQAAREKSRAFARSVPEDAKLSPRAWERVGQSHEANADVGLAEAAYRRAIASEPRPLIALNNLAMILARSARAGEALPLAQEVVKRRPDEPEFADTLAFVHLKLKDPASAIALYEQNVERQPDNANWPLHIVQVMLDHGDQQGAAARWETLRGKYDESKLPEPLRERWSRVAALLKTAPAPAK